MGTVVRLDGPGAVSIAEEPDPPLGPAEVRLGTLYSGISAGTELTQYRGTNAHFSKTWDPLLRVFVPGAPAVTYPAVVGYEEVGVVIETGPEATGVRTGQIVWGVWGHRSTAVVAADYAAQRVLAPGADPLLGIFSHIGSVALNIVLDADIHVGETVAVFGMGVLGQIVAQLARRNGARVIAVDALAPRLELAAGLRLGEEFHHNRVQLVCSQISNVAPALAPRWDRARLATTVIDLAVTGALLLRPLVSHVIPVERAPDAYELLTTRPHEATQVVLAFLQPEP